MDTSQLMRLATQAGFTSSQRSNVLIMESLKVFARAIEIQVREECAAICEAHGNERLIIRPMSITDDPWKVGVFDCVELLRGDYKLEGRGKGELG